MPDNRRELERNLSLLLEKNVNVTNFKMLNAAGKARYAPNGRMNLRTITQSIALTANTTARMAEKKDNYTEDL
ncbi:hypothetical protein [Elizabethkingia anophelis]|uniref:hypothetical protein n=1 Tax=Elizabethkingia anophelis TaxID=1117645 RepID=UPI000D02BFB8|nr:hypothetical protein [Elizabethkingia anophelis]MYY46430.1 hypothetical protein [Elizabethkingia anophelis]PRQ84166.1 hypothetical protein CMT86_18155 [Elizabethkingia anophelis]PRQ85066.1 hypothetical protein CMT87_02605 [Elizabethkingia anophelis]